MKTTYWLTCQTCGQKFEAKRYNATSCSTKCRKRKSRRPAELKEMWLLSASYLNQIGLEMRWQKRSRGKPNFELRRYLEDLRSILDDYLGASDV